MSPKGRIILHPVMVWRLQHKLLIPEFAKLIDASVGLVSRWENGKLPITAKYAERIEKATGGELKKEVLAFLDLSQFRSKKDLPGYPVIMINEETLTAIGDC